MLLLWVFKNYFWRVILRLRFSLSLGSPALQLRSWRPKAWTWWCQGHPWLEERRYVLCSHCLSPGPEVIPSACSFSPTELRCHSLSCHGAHLQHSPAQQPLENEIQQIDLNSPLTSVTAGHWTVHTELSVHI